MYRRAEQNYGLLKLLAKSSAKQRQAILDAAGKELLKSVCECAYNLLRGNISLSKTQKRKLAAKKKTLRDLTAKKVSLKRKREIILQRGGNLLSVLLPPIIQTLEKIFFNN